MTPKKDVPKSKGGKKRQKTDRPTSDEEVEVSSNYYCDEDKLFVYYLFCFITTSNYHVFLSKGQEAEYRQSS